MKKATISDAMTVQAALNRWLLLFCHSPFIILTYFTKKKLVFSG